jgi:hypothetical protein
VIQILIAFIFSFSVWSLDVGLEFSVPEIKQGSIVSAQIKLDATSAQEMPLQELKLKTFAETIYVYDVGTPIRKEGRPYFEADAKIIFVKVPESNQLTFTEEGVSYKVFWNEVKVVPTEVEKAFLYGAFSVPTRFQPFKWILILIGVGVISGIGFQIFRLVSFKNQKKKKLQDVKKKLLSPSSYDDVVQVWMNRQIYLLTFPAIDEAFRKFEQKLFKVQFKPSQTEHEKAHVVDSYNEFLASIKGPLDGI